MVPAVLAALEGLENGAGDRPAEPGQGDRMAAAASDPHLQPPYGVAGGSGPARRGADTV